MSEVCGDCGSLREGECRRMPPTALDRQHEAARFMPGSDVPLCCGAMESYVAAVYPPVSEDFPACDEFHPREDWP